MQKERLEVIQEKTISFPQFFKEKIEDEPTDIVAAMYVSNQAQFSPLGLPEYLVVNREVANGVITVGTYMLTSTTKVNSLDPPPVIHPSRN